MVKLDIHHAICNHDSWLLDLHVFRNLFEIVLDLAHVTPNVQKAGPGAAVVQLLTGVGLLVQVVECSVHSSLLVRTHSVTRRACSAHPTSSRGPRPPPAPWQNRGRMLTMPAGPAFLGGRFPGDARDARLVLPVWEEGFQLMMLGWLGRRVSADARDACWPCLSERGRLPADAHDAGRVLLSLASLGRRVPADDHDAGWPCLSGRS